MRTLKKKKKKRISYSLNIIVAENYFSFIILVKPMEKPAKVISITSKIQINLLNKQATFKSSKILP